MPNESEKTDAAIIAAIQQKIDSGEFDSNDVIALAMLQALPTLREVAIDLKKIRQALALDTVLTTGLPVPRMLDQIHSDISETNLKLTELMNITKRLKK